MMFARDAATLKDVCRYFAIKVMKPVEMDCSMTTQKLTPSHGMFPNNFFISVGNSERKNSSNKYIIQIYCLEDFRRPENKVRWLIPTFVVKKGMRFFGVCVVNRKNVVIAVCTGHY